MNLFHEIALTQIKQFGPRRIRALLDTFGDAETVFNTPRETLDGLGQIAKYLFDGRIRDNAFRRAEKEMEFISKNSVEAIHYTDSRYPRRLAQCVDAPTILYACGTDDLNSGRYVAVVGTRKSTPYGKDLTCNFVRDLKTAVPDVTIVSGLAYGIDVHSHRAALDNGARTIGVVAHGLDMIYPAAHRSIAAKMIAEGGGIVTEYLSATNPDPQNFIQRNRIVAGMCDALVVVESASKGGALITAGMAVSYSRDVFAFPGRVGDAASAGCNMLLRSTQAGLIESAMDLVKAERWEAAKIPVQTAMPIDLTAGQQSVYEALKDTPLHVADLALQVNMKIAELSPILIDLEMDGVIESMAGGRYRIIAN